MIIQPSVNCSCSCLLFECLASVTILTALPWQDQLLESASVQKERERKLTFFHTLNFFVLIDRWPVYGTWTDIDFEGAYSCDEYVNVYFVDLLS